MGHLWFVVQTCKVEQQDNLCSISDYNHLCSILKLEKKTLKFHNKYELTILALWIKYTNGREHDEDTVNAF